MVYQIIIHLSLSFILTGTRSNPVFFHCHGPLLVLSQPPTNLLKIYNLPEVPPGTGSEPGNEYSTTSIYISTAYQNCVTKPLGFCSIETICLKWSRSGFVTYLSDNQESMVTICHETRIWFAQTFQQVRQPTLPHNNQTSCSCNKPNLIL